jgi:hypothetical protein
MRTSFLVAAAAAAVVAVSTPTVAKILPPDQPVPRAEILAGPPLAGNDQSDASYQVTFHAWLERVCPTVMADEKQWTSDPGLLRLCGEVMHEG